MYTTGGANLNPADMLARLQQEKRHRLQQQEQEQIALDERAREEEELGIITGTRPKNL